MIRSHPKRADVNINQIASILSLSIRSMISSREPDIAEDLLSLLGSEAGVICHRPKKDQQGWDFMAEFPDDISAIPVASQISRIAFIQVKSRTTARYSSPFKLTNAIRAASSPDPWFFLLVVFNKKTHDRAYYIIHVWGDIIFNILKLARQSEVNQEKFNQVKMNISFLKYGEKVDNPIEFIKRTIQSSGDTYRDDKKRIYDQSGYETGYGTGTITLNPTSPTQLLRAMLGDRTPIPAHAMSFTPARFNIPDRIPLIQSALLDVTFTPEPVGRCEIILTKSDFSETLSFSGNVFSAAIPISPNPMSALKFRAEFIDVFTDLNGKGTIKARIENDKPQSLQTLHKFSIFNLWCDEGELHFQVQSDGRMVLAGRFSNINSTSSIRWDDFRQLMLLLSRLAGERERNIFFSLNDINSVGLAANCFQSVIWAKSLKFNFQCDDPQVGSAESLTYYFTLTIADWTFQTIVKGELLSKEILDDRYTLVFSNQKIISGSAIRNGTEEDHSRLKSQYHSYIESLNTLNSFDCGDMSIFLQENGM